VKIEIKNRFNDSVLFSHEAEENTLKITMLMALKAGADLCEANLRGANLRGANLREANLCEADLRGADLRGADLRGANLCEANLSGADLRGANLRGADLRGLKLVGDRPFIQIGPIGSRSDYLFAFITDKGLRITAGCFQLGTRDQFELKLAESHGMNKHGIEYLAALSLIDTHVELWTPKEPARFRDA